MACLYCRLKIPKNRKLMTLLLIRYINVVNADDKLD